MDNGSKCPLLDSLGSKCNFSLRSKNDIRKTRLEVTRNEIKRLLQTHRNTIESKALDSLLKSLDEETNLCELKKKISSKICSSIELLTEPSKISSLNTRNLVSRKIQYIGGGYDDNRKLMYKDIKFIDGEYDILIHICEKDDESVLCDFYKDMKINDFKVEQKIFNNLYNFLNQYF